MSHINLLQKNSSRIFMYLIFIFYCAIPLVTWLSSEEHRYEMLYLFALSAALIISLYFGAKIPTISIPVRFKSSEKAMYFIAFSFLIVTILIISTASSIPILEAIKGASPETLKIARGDFLKTRTGYENLYIYISSIYTGSLMPYIIILLFFKKSKWRFLYLFSFLIYSLSFLQKSLFLNILLPFVIYKLITNKTNKTTYFLLFIASIIALIVFTTITYEPNDAISAGNINLSSYMSTKYVPTSSIDYFIWRSFAVPVFTASDTILVLINNFNGDYLLGGTSQLISLITGVTHVNIERYVFEYQFGGWNDIMNANSVYHIEGYVNFGIFGVVLYGLISGYIFKVFSTTKNLALASMWILFAWSIFNASLIGTMLSNGWLFTFFLSIFVKPSSNWKTKK